jgi:hypothetical protein
MSTPEETARQRGWPPGVRVAGYEAAELLGVDNDKRLYWDGHPIEVRRRLDLTFWQKAGAVIVGSAVVITALGTVAQGIDAGHNFGCKMHWWTTGCAKTG